MEMQVEYPRTEILHVGNFDILINQRQTSITSEELLALTHKIIKDLEDNPEEKPMSQWNKTNHYRIFLSDSTHPKYAAKEKWIEPDEGILIQAIKVDRARANRAAIDTKKTYYSTDSILNEMSLAGKIKQVIESQEVQEIFQKAGAELVDFAEPLVGIIDRRTRKKTIVYPYKKGERFYNYFKSSDNTDPYLAAAAELYHIYKKHGIYPGDFNLGQFVIETSDSGKPIFHALDIEQYYRQ